MKAAELKDRLRCDRPMVSVTLRMPENVLALGRLDCFEFWSDIMNRKSFIGVLAGLGLMLGTAGQVNAEVLYASYTGSQLGFTIRHANTLKQYAWRDTGIVASGIAVDASNNVYLPAANHLRKYNSDGALLVDMTFPIPSINYTDVAVSGNKLYATYNGSQLGVTVRNTSDLSQTQYFNTGVSASGIAVDPSGNFYITADNHIRKYSPAGNLLVDMTFPIDSINYTAIAFSGGYVYASYNGSQLGVTKRDANTLKQVQYFDTSLDAEGISVSTEGNIYLSAGNQLRKYNNSGALQKDMTFPIPSINYSGVTIK